MKHFLLGLLIAASSAMAVVATAQVSTDADAMRPQPAEHGKPVEISMKRAGSTSIDLRQLPPGKVRKRERPEREEPEANPIELPGSIPMQPAGPVGGPSAPAAAPLASFLGLDFNNWGAGHPPDTNGDVGPTYFIETVNTSIGIYNKSTGVRVAAFTFDTFMSQGAFGNLCDTDNFGDPVVLYDSFEDRWVISDFAFKLDGSGNVVNPPGNFECIAVSKTGDPVAGGWNFYSINTAGGLGDYPKLGVWPDGIYMSVNMFDYAASGSFQKVRLYAFNKAQMYAGAPGVQVVSFDAPAGEFTLLPANARLQTGTPPAGAPNYFSVVWQFTNAVSVYKFHVDWNSISTSTLTGPFITIAPASWAIAPSTVPSQGGNANDTLARRLMAQNQYTNIAGVESIWNSHAVQGSSASQAAVRYYQVNVTGGTVAASTTQAATHNPDANNRYMSSAAVDRAGNMAIGYSVSSSALHPAIRYAGRLSTDPVNTLTQSESSLIEGAGSQSGNCGASACTRWGDYSSMSLDPDGCTFWMSNEYYADISGNWQTRIGAFKFPAAACTPVSSGSVQGTVTATVGGAPIAGATVSLGSRTTTTDAGGAYTFAGIPSGTYPALSAAAAGYTTGTTTNVVVTDGNATTKNFSLSAAAVSACLLDTTQADFQMGIPTSVDLTTSAGDVQLLNPSVIDQQNTTVTNSGFAFSSAAWVGQTFTAGSSGQLTQVDVDLFCSSCTGTTPNITASIRATSGGLPTGADLAVGTIAGFSSGSAGYFSAVFGSPVAITAGTTYAIVLRPVSNPSAGTYAYVTSSGSAYAGGQRVTSGDSGSTWAGDASRDLGFKVYVKSSFVSSGDLISSTKDANPATGNTPSWSTFSWTAATPANTTLSFQAAGSNSKFGPFNFVGPDGTAATFYTTSGSSLSQFSGKRYLQYRAFLATTNNAVTPVLNDATVCYSNTSGPTADLSIANSDGVATATPGGSVTYTITAANSGPSAAVASTVADTFPAALTCSWTCVGAGGGTCTASGSGNINSSVNLPSSGSVTYTASCTVGAGATGSLVNTATVAVPAGVTDPTPGNNSATDTDTLAPSANLGITNNDGVTTATPGGSVTYTIIALNAGPSNAPGSTVADTFPAALTCSWTCVGAGGGTCTASGSGNINNSVNLPSGGNVTYTASCTIGAGATGSLSNTATVAVSASVTDPTPGDNSATDTDTLSPNANLAITNTDGVTTATPGGSVNYTITASNTGPSNAPGSTVADSFPASLTCSWTCVGASGGTCTASGSGNINNTVNLPSGGSVTYTASCTIGAGATGSLVNTATVAAAAGITDPASGNNTATDTDTLAPSANLAITKTDGVTTAAPGGTVSYTITASNLGPSNAPGSTVADTFPAALTCSWTCVGAGGGTCTASGSGNINASVNLPSGGSVTYAASCNISAAATGSLVNTATVAAAGGITDPTPGNNSATDTDTLSPSANLGITNTDGVTTATPGGSVNYTITATNAGPSNAPGSTVADTFPASLTCSWTCVGAGSGTCTASGSGNINDTAGLPSGGSVTYTASCNISASATGSLSNTATVTAPVGTTDPASGNNTATDTDTLAPKADLAITKSDGVTTATPGGSVNYTITASNTGPSNAPGSTVADTFPASLTCSWTCVGAGGGTCTASGSGNINDSVNLPSGGNVTYTASCAIAAGATGSLGNIATVTVPGSVTDPTPGNNTATDTDTLSPSANLGITNNDGVTTATPGGSVTYTITASNAGPSNAPGSTVSDSFPASLTCSWTCAGSGSGTCTASGSGNINDPVNLPSGGSVTYTASCTVGAGATGSLVNAATVAAAGGIADPSLGNNSATDTDTLAPNANLAITNTDGVTTATPGGSVNYTITASNPGPSNAPGSTVADTFPASLTCSWTCVGSGSGTCTASGSGNINDPVNLPSGGSVTYTASCTLGAGATGSLVNTATVAPAGGVTDPTPGNNSATDTDSLSPSANLGITNTDGVTTATPGGSVSYTITASNPGPSNAPGSTVADTFPAALTCSWTCVGAGGGTCTASGSGNINNSVNLPSGGSVTYTASCNISAAVTGSLVDTATIAVPAGVTDPTPGNNSATDTDTLAPSANLGITNTDGVTTATPGGSVTYTIAATNAGPSNALASTVADTFPASLTCSWTCVGSGSGTCTASGSGNINDSVNLPSGGTVTFTASCTVGAGATGSLVNTATVAPAGGTTDPTPGNNSATDTDTLAPSANLGITNSDGVTTATPGGSVNYTITASNPGPSNAPGSTVADTFPASLTCSWTCVGAGSGTCTASGSGNINDTVGLPSGGSVTYTASCSIGAGVTGSLINTATVAAPASVTDPTPGNNSATDTDTLSLSANLGITNTDGVTTATPGGAVSYTITASNAGPSNALASTVADTFPASLTCSWTCGGSGSGTCTASGSGNINDSVNLPSGGSVIYTANCTIAAGATGSLGNTATVAAPVGVIDPTPANNSAIDTDTLSVQADIAVTLSDSRSFAQVGDTLDYVIEVTNPSGPSIAIANVSDALPAELDGGSWTCTPIPDPGTICHGGTGNTLSDAATIPVGGKASYLYSATLQSDDALDLVVNTASASLASGSDPTPANNSASDTDIVVIFRDGFDGGASLLANVNAAGSSHVTAQMQVDAGLLAHVGIVPVDIASGRSPDGKRLFVLQIARFGSDVALRTLATDARGMNLMSEWQTVDLVHHVLEFAWQSAGEGQRDGYVAAAAGGPPVLIDARPTTDRLTRLLITVDHDVPWLLLIDR
jgi:uncharacterized repeat protein (TIGR01451 family)